MIGHLYCCSQVAQFRSMWTEFEWENRVNVTTTISWVVHVALHARVIHFDCTAIRENICTMS